jgi:hypothetical protein
MAEACPDEQAGNYKPKEGISHRTRISPLRSQASRQAAIRDLLAGPAYDRMERNSELRCF